MNKKEVEELIWETLDEEKDLGRMLPERVFLRYDLYNRLAPPSGIPYGELGWLGMEHGLWFITSEKRLQVLEGGPGQEVPVLLEGPARHQEGPYGLIEGPVLVERKIK